MSNPNKALIIHPDYPFKDEVERFKNVMKSTSRSTEIEGYKHRKITVIEESTYYPGAFTRMYKDQRLHDLSPEACKVMLTMALIMGWNEQRVNLTDKIVGLERRKFSKAMLELIQLNILRKEKPHWYWVNLTILLMGYIDTGSKVIEDKGDS